MTRSERAFRALLRVYPARARDAHGDDMAQLFADRLRDASSAGEVVTVWVEAVTDVVKTAPREHLDALRSPQVVEGSASEVARVPMKRDAALASLPLLASLVMLEVHPLGTVWGSLYANPPGVFGMPLGIAILVALAAMGSFGLFAARRTRELNDPWHQAVFLAILLVTATAVALAFKIHSAALYVLAGSLLLVVGRFRRLMLSLAIAPLVWLVFGPLVLGIIVPILRAKGEGL